MDLLRYGSEVEVLAPDFLREAVAAEARKTAAIYS
jgi:predicted DNA-binding transcriptional regulator YafY